MIRYGECWGVGCNDVDTKKLSDTNYTIKESCSDGRSFILHAGGQDEIWRRLAPKQAPNWRFRIKIGRSYYHMTGRV